MNRPYTDEQWYKMVDAEISRPVPLHKADLTSREWVYWRPWGLMFVGAGRHTLARATLLAFHHGEHSFLSLATKLDVPYRNAMADLADAFLLDLPGTAFLSSVSSKILAGKRDNLDAQERQAFRKYGLQINYLEDRDFT